MKTSIRDCSSLKHYIVMLILPFLITLAGCGSNWNGALGGGKWDSPVTHRPTVTCTDPENHAAAVPTGNKLSVTFSEAMSPATINEATFTLQRGAIAVPGTVSYSGYTAIFTPSAALLGTTYYTATITTGAKNLEGQGLDAEYVWSFTSGVAPDSTRPTVTLTVPANDATAVPLGNALSAVFSEPIDPLTVTGASFTLKRGIITVPGAVTYSGLTALFTPASDLLGSTVYTATITTVAADLAGNTLLADHVWNFTTGAAPDVLLPTVSFTSPSNGSSAIAINRKVNVAFSEAMNPLTVNNVTFTLTGPGAAVVPGTVTSIGSTATFTPLDDMANSTTYTATITSGARDLAGNAIAADYSWSFTTGAAPDIVAPTVSLTSPTNASVAVPINRSLNIGFSEAMTPSSITTLSFTLRETVSGNAVPGAVSAVGTSATFVPTSSLTSSTGYTCTITTGVKDLAGNPLASNFTFTFNTGVAADLIAPTVSFTSPAGGSESVPFNRKLDVAFSEPMSPLTVNSLTFTLTGPGATEVSGTVTTVGSTATFTPLNNLPASTAFTGTLTTGVKDLAGNSMASNYTFTFATGAAPDIAAPTVTFTSPANDAADVPFNRQLHVAFSESMDALTVTNSTFKLTGPGLAAVIGTVTSVGSTATFTPQSNLLASTAYEGRLTTGATDLAGNHLGADYVWSFTTGAAPDVIAPMVSVTSPTNTAIAVPVNRRINVGFSEAMIPATITALTFTLKETVSGNNVPGAVTAVATSATLVPTNDLTPSTGYTATITTGVKDLAGNPMASDFNFTFTTGIVADTVAPTVSITSPFDGETAVPLNRNITASFSETMDPFTLTNTTFKLTAPGIGDVAGAVTSLGSTATFTPFADMVADTTYTATVTTGAKDLAGNALEANFIWSFTTSVALDTTAPIVLSTIPLDLAIAVPNNTLVTGTFQEAMDPLTIVSSNFFLTETVGGAVVSGTVTYASASKTAIFTPLNDLDFGKSYTATIYGGVGGVADLAGNVLLVDESWTFSTGVAPDVIGPTLVLENPADLDTDVALNASVNATFSEAMDPLTINTASFTVDGVVGLVSYNPLSMVATFDPTGNLSPNTTYTVTITSEATDLAGNALASGLLANPWTFRTGTGLAPGAVALGSAGGYGIMATSAVTNTGFTTINGDVSLDPGTSMTGFPPGIVNGSVHVNDAVSAQARVDLLVAYNFAKALPPGTTIGAGGDLGALYPLGIPPGTYTSGSTMLVASPLVLDAGGNADAVWVFQIGSSLTTGASVSLAGGAQAKNVFWVPTDDATVGIGTIFYGTIVSGRDVTGVTGAVINGRILAGAITGGTVALDTNTVNVPAP